MGFLYKRRNTKTGKLMPNWYMRYKDVNGRTADKSTKTRDKQVATQIIAQAEREVAQRRVGLHDGYAENRKKPLSDHVDDYITHLRSKGNNVRYVNERGRQLRCAFGTIQAKTLADLDMSKADEFLASLTTGEKPKSARTRDHHAAGLKSFGAWACDIARRWPHNPFAKLVTRTAKGKREFKRRAFKFEEVELLVQAAEVRPVQEYRRTHPNASDGKLVELEREGKERGLLYWFTAMNGGWRHEECAALRWRDLELDSSDPWVQIHGEDAKNDEDARVPLLPWVAERLAARRKERALWQGAPVRGEDRVFYVPDTLARLVRKDACWAGITGTRKATAQRVDFHCLRTSCGSILAACGVHPKIAQRILRHKDIRVTMQNYTHLDWDQMRAALKELPVPTEMPTEDGPSLSQQGTQMRMAPSSKKRGSVGGRAG